MNSIELLRHQAHLAHAELMEAITGVTEGQAWSVLPQGGPDYLHTDGSIHGIALHCATGRIIYGSVGFRDTEIRWRDLADQVEQFEPNWAQALAYVEQSQEYWLGTWASLDDDDLEREVPHFSGKQWPIWKILRMVIHHDSYHAGQIVMLRYACGETDVPPPSVAADIRQYCVETPAW